MMSKNCFLLVSTMLIVFQLIISPVVSVAYNPIYCNGINSESDDTKWSYVGNARLVTEKEDENIEGVSSTFDVQLTPTEMAADATYNVLGVILENGKIQMADATGVLAVLIRKNSNQSSAMDKLTVQAFGGDDRIIAEETHDLSDEIGKGAQSIELESVMPFVKASYLKAFISNKNDIILSTSVDKITQGSYKGLPLASD